jgi:ATPase subunit of ABC transporter with duplicated ATPase domains
MITKKCWLVKSLPSDVKPADEPKLQERTMSNKERIAQLEKEIEEMEARLPKHSVPPAMIIELEDLEEELEMLKARASRESD